MDISHRDSVLFTSCLKTPINPQTKVPTTLYERERVVQLLPMHKPHHSSDDNQNFEEARAQHWHKDDSGDESVESSSENEKDQSYKHFKNKEPEDNLYVHEKYHSNEDYYNRLEELKQAHMEAMKKLEHMYQNKLHLKGVQLLDNDHDISDQYCSSKQKSNPHLSPRICMTLNQFEVDSTKHADMSDSSGEAAENTEVETVTESESMSSLQDHIYKMWDGFSVEDYVQTRKYNQLSSNQIKKMKKTKEWSPKITIPEPFHMTIREAKKQREWMKSRSVVDLENYMLQKQMEEEAECQKKFRANPVPATVYLPLYDEIMARNEERRKFVTERSKEILISTQKPFSFIEREEKKKQLRKLQLRDIAPPKMKKTKFKAKPVPKYVYDPNVNERIKEQELYRAIKMHMRAQELLNSSYLPRNMHSRSAPPQCGKCRYASLSDNATFRPNINSKVPDFEMLHQKNQKQLMEKKNLKETTVCEPFTLCTSHILSRKDKILQDIEADEETLKETRWPYKSYRHPPGAHCSSPNYSPMASFDSRPARGTKASNKRQEAVKKQDKQRMKQYLKELEEMHDRVNNRPLLLQQVTQHNAKQAAEKHYSDILREVGLNDEFVSSKGRTSKKLHYHVSDTDSDISSDCAKRHADER
ncbi:protein FAM161A [Protopterus annectens]|uniref:protein FAM161A n=1 Tax=Protopterus annectens TaxID=7888 RepID=UPI001CFBDD36|nr:protein FAM161A [Protopterus annectens]